MQSNQVSISCVYPCVLVIQNKLSEVNAELMYTKQLRKDLLESLNKRFGDLIESDLCLISSFLDPRFGPEKREKVKMRLKYHLGLTFLVQIQIKNKQLDLLKIFQINSYFIKLRPKQVFQVSMTMIY
jgi:hypothetical protein